jgi:methylthioribose-1-phosphate isomerase
VRERVLPEEDIQLAKALLLRTAQNILLEDQDLCQRIGLAGAELLNDGDVILTHCNAGALATSGIGTALSVIYKAQEQGKNVKVFADETRPLLQGSRLTAWELAQNSVDVTVITDNMAAHVIRDKGVKVIIVGADRIVANGDVANKIGTYNLAVLAEKHKIPFYVAAPFSTFDIALASGQEIAIEERESYEIENGFGKQTVPKGVRVYNPAFDMTPHELVTALITDQGVLYPPFDVKIVRLNSGEALSSQKIL